MTYIADDKVCVMLQGLRFIKLESSATSKGYRSNWWLRIGYKGHYESIYYESNGQAARAMYAKVRKALTEKVKP